MVPRPDRLQQLLQEEDLLVVVVVVVVAAAEFKRLVLCDPYSLHICRLLRARHTFLYLPAPSFVATLSMPVASSAALLPPPLPPNSPPPLLLLALLVL
jgi:hypothetical protein